MADALIVRRTGGYGEIDVINAGYVSISINYGFPTDRYGTITFSEPINPSDIVGVILHINTQLLQIHSGYKDNYEILKQNPFWEIDILSITETQMDLYIASYPNSAGRSVGVQAYLLIKQ